MPIERRTGRDFSDAIKEEARRLAGFWCCYCRRRMGDDVHHIDPKEEGGEGVLDNAILLCAQCHRDYGDRRDKRQTLRQARTYAYELAEEERRNSPNTVAMLAVVQELATKNDVQALMAQVTSLTDNLKAGLMVGTTTAPVRANIASTMINSITPHPVLTGFAPGTWAKGVLATLCGGCKIALPPNAAFCPQCGIKVGESS